MVLTLTHVLFSQFIFPEAKQWCRSPGLPYTLFLPNTKFMSEELSKAKFYHEEKNNNSDLLCLLSKHNCFVCSSCMWSRRFHVLIKFQQNLLKKDIGKFILRFILLFFLIYECHISIAIIVRRVNSEGCIVVDMDRI